MRKSKWQKVEIGGHEFNKFWVQIIGEIKTANTHRKRPIGSNHREKSLFVMSVSC